MVYQNVSGSSGIPEDPRMLAHRHPWMYAAAHKDVVTIADIDKK
jgi:hypothetical protein